MVNAVEHGEGRDVVVRLASAGGAVAVAVRDYGVGLKPGEATRVFSRFWRADPARARTTGGTGLGLSIALEDARLHGGWLQAWGEPGGGSQFRLTVPRTADEALRGSPIPLEPADSRRNQGAAEEEQEPVAPVAPAPRTGAATTVLHAPGVGLARLSAGSRAAGAEDGADRCRLPSRAAPRPVVDPTALPGSGSRVVARSGSPEGPREHVAGETAPVASGAAPGRRPDERTDGTARAGREGEGGHRGE